MSSAKGTKESRHSEKTMKITIGLRKRKEPIKEFKELGEAMAEFKKAVLEVYIKSPMGKLSICILDAIKGCLEMEKSYRAIGAYFKKRGKSKQ